MNPGDLRRRVLQRSKTVYSQWIKSEIASGPRGAAGEIHVDDIVFVVSVMPAGYVYLLGAKCAGWAYRKDYESIP